MSHPADDHPAIPVRGTRVLIATFPEGQTGPHAFLRALMDNAVFRSRCDVVLWHVPDLYRGVIGKVRLCRDAWAQLHASRACAVYLNLDMSLAFWLCIAFRLGGTRRLVTRSLNSVFTSPATRLGRAIYRHGISLLAHVRIAISAEAARAMYAKGTDDVLMIPCLIDFDALHARAAELPSRRYRPGDRFVFGCVGRLMAQKNQALIIRALAEAIRQGSDAELLELLLVGEGEDRSMLAELAANEGIADRVRFMGVTDNIGAVYCTSLDALLVPSLYEGQGRIVAEAQSFGLPLALSAGVPRMAVLDEDGVIAGLPLEVAAWCAAMRQLMEIPRRPARSLETLNRHPLSLACGVVAFCDALTGTAATLDPDGSPKNGNSNAS